MFFLTSGWGDWISYPWSSRWHASSTRPWRPWSSKPTTSAWRGEHRRYKNGKTKVHAYSKEIFCFLSCFKMLSLISHLLYLAAIRASDLGVAVICICKIFIFWALILHTCFSLVTQLCVLVGHGCDVILLALALSLWGSAWAPALARCTRARFFCLLLNHVRPAWSLLTEAHC